MQVVHRRGINHSDAHTTDSTVLSGTNPPAQITGVGNHALGIGKNLVRLFSQKLSPPLSFEQRKSKPSFKFGESLRQRRGRDTERRRCFGERFVIGHRDEVGQLLHCEIEQWALGGGTAV
jgi:hypothetical protein